MPNNKSYTIRTKDGEEYVDIDLNLNQDIDIFEVLSLKLDSKNFYKMQASNYGCIAGRVLANNAIGVPNAKISVFIAANSSTKSDTVLNSLYPYSAVFEKNDEGVIYNLLTEEQISECQKTAGTFPTKRLVLDDSNVFEIFDTYYKFTTTTNAAGDYMIFGVPTGVQNIHMDVDLSNIGSLLSQTPRDFIYKGYDKNLFESPTQFKTDGDLTSLPQIVSQNESVYVYPFWGDPSEMKESDSTGVRISRKDINVSYKFEPTCIFMGSIISDEKSNGFSEKCVPTDRMGKMDKLTTGEGTIEMIRKTPDGEVESYNISGTHLIDGDGTWCYQIPMNLDFIRMDEKGNIVPSDDPNKGLPTRTSVRFRFSLNDFASDYENNHLCKMLVPNNPYNANNLDNLYVFGTKTRDEDFRDLLWNKVYSVKSYIPRIQKSDANKERRFSGFKTVNVNGSNNPLPYNNIRVDITFMFILQCAIMHTLIWMTGLFNSSLGAVIRMMKGSGTVDTCYKMHYNEMTCLTVGDGACPDLEGWYFAPKCEEEIKVEGKATVELLRQTMSKINEKVNCEFTEYKTCPRCNGRGTIQKEWIFLGIHTGILIDEKCSKCNGTGTIEVVSTYSDTESIDYRNSAHDEKVCVASEIDYFIKCIELALAKEYEVIQFDFYNDWMNGVLYIPRWFAKVKKKGSYLFGLIRTRERVLGCMEDQFNIYRRYTQQCALKYQITQEGHEVTDVNIINNYGCLNNQNVQNCHKKKGRRFVRIFKKGVWNPGGGIVHQQPHEISKQFAYYFRPRDFSNNTFVTFYASDIILLGSVSNNDIDGIPFISELQSSSYKMPTSLAATNMDIMGEMFGSFHGGGIKCNSAAIPSNLTYEPGTKVIKSSVENVNDNFEEYSIYALYEDGESVGDSNVISTEQDDSEYPLTEASGIDWGYTGPEQKDIQDEITDNNVRKTFYPGGHFLGLSCFNAETNVRSCVNLSRICEIGIEMSRRKKIENDGRSGGTDLQIVPTGLISNFDIYDGDFRSIFATLNHNELKTVFDNNTGRFVYDLIPMCVVGFDGSMKGFTAWDDTTKNFSERKVFSKTPEVFDKNYYYFRLGLKNYKNLSLDNVYADSQTFGYGLPMYNNSFYFYFGLHDGATALDKFHDKFYGVCKLADIE